MRQTAAIAFCLMLAVCASVMGQTAEQGQPAQSAQAAPPAQPAPPVARRLLVSVQPAGYSKREAAILSRSLALALQAGAPGVVVLELPPQEPLPVDDARKLDVTTKSGADAWLWVGLEGTRASPVLRVRSYDAVYLRSFDTQVQKEQISLPDPQPETWNEIVALVNARYNPIGLSSIVNTAGSARLVVHALPGTMVSVRQGHSASVDSSGTASIPVDSPGQYSVRANLADYATWNGEVFVRGDTDLAIDQRPGPRWAIETGARELSVPSVQALLFIRPGFLFIRAGLTTYLSTLALTPDMVFDSRPLTLFSIASGFFLSPDDSPVRLYTAFDLFVRIVHAPDSLPFVDPVAAWGMRLIVGTEFLPMPGARLYAEWTPTLYVTPNPGIFQLSLGQNAVGLYHVTSTSVEQPFSLTFGIRWYP